MVAPNIATQRNLAANLDMHFVISDDSVLKSVQINTYQMCNLNNQPRFGTIRKKRETSNGKVRFTDVD